MPAVNIITPILGSNYYHIFNRGINRQNIFFSERNYFYFLQLVNRFLSDYISVLAEHWVMANNQPDIVFSKSCAIVSYEDFNMNKEEYIEQLAIKLGLKPINTITHLVDKQFQPKGNSNVNLKDFYGEKNYSKIENICNKLIKEFY